MMQPNSIENEFPGIISNKISFFEYVFVLMLMLYAGRANSFFETESIKANPIGVLIPVCLAGILAFKWKVIFTRQFYTIIFFFAIYFLATSIKYYVVQPTFFLTYLFLIFISYTAIKALKVNLFIIYEYLLYWLAIIALFMWVAQLVLRGDTLYGLFARVPLLESISTVSGSGLNAIFYSLQPYSTTLINNYTIPRNCGFAWEPGSFAVYLCLGIFINLFITKTGKFSKRRFWVLLLALVSTQSTTGYVIMMVLIIYYLINKDFKRVLLLFPVAIVLIISIFSLPFMKNKIFDLFSETSGINQLIVDAYGRESPATPQRFTSFMITLVDFRHNPILGLAAHYEDTWTYKMGSSISTISGIGNLLAQFGIVGFLFFTVYSVKSSLFFSKYFKYKGKLLGFILILLISISYSIIFLPLLMCFWLFSLCEPDLQNQKELSDPESITEMSSDNLYRD